MGLQARRIKRPVNSSLYTVVKQHLSHVILLSLRVLMPTVSSLHQFLIPFWQPVKELRFTFHVRFTSIERLQ
jgi:hypothetical protein